MVVAAAVATAMLNLYVDVQSKLQREFRNYGANIVVVSKNGTDHVGTDAFVRPAKAKPSQVIHESEVEIPKASAPELDALTKIDSILAGHGIAAPFGMIVARTADGQPIVVAGTDFDRVKQLNRWWQVSAWPSAPGQALLGVRASSTVSRKGQPFDLTFQGKTLHVTPAGTVHTGAAEDSRIYISLDDFVNWTGVQPSTIEVAATGSPAEIAATLNRIAQAIPAADVRPVRKIVEGEARVLGKTRSTLLAAAALIILTAALCVLSTLMGWVFDRRRDFAIMKALGASSRLLGSFFAAEAVALGATGALIGFLLGLGIAAWIGHANFHASVTPRFSVLPIVLLGSMAVTLLSSILPISLLRRVQPAVILRGE
jgi:putative ABC transport system permease protein